MDINNLKSNDTNIINGGSINRTNKRVKKTIEEKKVKKSLLNTKYYYRVTKLKRQLKRIEKLNSLKNNEK